MTIATATRFDTVIISQAGTFFNTAADNVNVNDLTITQEKPPAVGLYSDYHVECAAGRIITVSSYAVAEDIIANIQAATNRGDATFDCRQPA